MNPIRPDISTMLSPAWCFAIASIVLAVAARGPRKRSIRRGAGAGRVTRSAEPVEENRGRDPNHDSSWLERELFAPSRGDDDALHRR